MAVLCAHTYINRVLERRSPLPSQSAMQGSANSQVTSRALILEQPQNLICRSPKSQITAQLDGQGSQTIAIKLKDDQDSNDFACAYKKLEKNTFSYCSYFYLILLLIVAIYF